MADKGNEQQIATSIKNFLEVIKGLHELAPGLESLAGIKEKVAETTAQHDQLKASMDKMTQMLQSARDEHGRVKLLCAKDLEAGRAAAKAEIERGRAEAGKLRAGAGSDITKGQNAAEEELRILNDQIVSTRKQLDMLNTQAGIAEDRRRKARKEFDDLVERVKA